MKTQKIDLYSYFIINKMRKFKTDYKNAVTQNLGSPYYDSEIPPSSKLYLTLCIQSGNNLSIIKDQVWGVLDSMVEREVYHDKDE
jgi:hypothetical protein